MASGENGFDTTVLMGGIGLELSLFFFYLAEARGCVADGVCLLSLFGVNILPH